MKKVISLCLVAMIFFLSGCGGQKANQKVELVLGLWDKNQEPVIKEILAEYSKEHPNVTVKTQLTPYKGREYWTKLEASSTGGTAPDIFWMNGLNVENFIEGQMLADFGDELNNGSLKLSDYPTSLSDLYTFEGKVYGVPKDFDTNALWYNKELFEAAGVAYPTDDWTWAEFAEAAKKLTDKEKGIYGTAAPLDFQTCYYQTIYAAGGYVLDKDKTKLGFDQPETQEGIQIWIDLIEAGVSPTLQEMTDTSADAMFESGKIAMLWAGSYMTPEYLGNDMIKDKVDLVEAPAYKGKKANLINGLAYSVYAKSKHLTEAKKLAVWLGGEKAMKIQGQSGIVISARKDAQKYFEESNQKLNLGAYTRQSDLATVLPCTKVSGQLFKIEIENLKKAYAGEESLAQACQTIVEQGNETLAKGK